MAGLPTRPQNRLRWWLGFEPDESAISLVPYMLFAGILGFGWYKALQRLPPTRDFLAPDSTRGWRAVLDEEGMAFVVTTCLVATFFRRQVLRTKPVYLPLLAVVLMVLGAMLFAWMVCAPSFFGGDDPHPWGFDDLAAFAWTGAFAAEMAVIAGAVTIPGAIVIVFLLRWSGRIRHLRV